MCARHFKMVLLRSGCIQIASVALFILDQFNTSQSSKFEILNWAHKLNPNKFWMALTLSNTFSFFSIGELSLFLNFSYCLSWLSCIHCRLFSCILVPFWYKGWTIIWQNTKFQNSGSFVRFLQFVSNNF